MAGERLQQAFNGVLAELAEERASALSRSGAKVEAALASCTALLGALDAAPADALLLSQYQTARKAFDGALWAYCVHREAIGLWDHRWVHRTWPRPPRRGPAPDQPAGSPTT